MVVTGEHMFGTEPRHIDEAALEEPLFGELGRCMRKRDRWCLHERRHN
mgnify:CR=1 FL=1